MVQSLHSDRFGYAWLRVREFLWTIVAFHVSKLVGYVPPRCASSRMNTRRFYTAQELRRDVMAAGLRDPVAAGAACVARSLAGGRRVDVSERDV